VYQASRVASSVRERDDSTVVISLTGELDMASCDDVEATMLAAIEVWPRVVVDLGGVRFCDSCGLTVFVRCELAADDRGGSFALADPGASVRRIIEIGGLAHLLVP
jgi:anti-anti-sigma factor